MPPFSQPPRPPMPGVPGGAPRPPMPPMQGGAPRPPMPPGMQGAPRPPMPGMPGAAPRPPMPQGMPAGAPRPPMPQQPGAQGGFGPRPPMPQQANAQGGFGPRPPMPQQQNPQAGFGAPRPQGPQQGGFGAQPNVQAQNGMFSQQSSEINFGDQQYIKDLQALQEFYEQNKYTEILAQRYEDFEIPGWDAPTITLPKDEIYSRLKYYDDIKKYENLDERQLILVQKKINDLIKQLNYIDDYEHYQEYGSDLLSYNDKFLDENRTIRWFQRENDIKTETGFSSDIRVAIPKEKWWMLGLENALNENGDDVYVNNATIPGAENPILSHPMFNGLKTVGGNEDLSNERILVDYPNTQARTPLVNAGEENAQPENNKQKKRFFWQKKDKQKGASKMPQSNNQAQQASPGFPRKENPQGPKAPAGGGFPQRQNPQAPTPNGGFGPRPQPQAPTPGGFGNKPPQQGQGFFGYQR